jgi:hypothetical protein
VEFLLFTAVAVILYVVADRILVAVETARGAMFGQRTVVFFGLLLTLALSTFAILRALFGD